VSTIPNSDHFPTAVFLGDSVTTGWRALSHPRNRWTSLVCEHQRWRGTPVIVAPYFPSLEIGPRFQAIHRLVHEGATSLGLSSTDALTTAINGDEDRLAIDQIHPDDAGHAQMARAMISLYAELLPSA